MRKILCIHSAALGLSVAAALTAFPGCGSSNAIHVTGKVLKGGKPFACPPGRNLGVTLVALEVKGDGDRIIAGGEPFAAQVNPEDSTFIVPGPEGTGIPPGRYRVALAQRPTVAAVAEARTKAGKRISPINRETDFFKNQFSPASSPIVRKLETSCELIIDLDRPTEDGGTHGVDIR